MVNTVSKPLWQPATVVEVLPRLGLAYACDDEGRSWGITGATKGAGLLTLRPGKRVDLTIDHHEDCSLVASYRAID